jgi:hypothetical protein
MQHDIGTGLRQLRADIAPDRARPCDDDFHVRMFCSGWMMAVWPSGTWLSHPSNVVGVTGVMGLAWLLRSA